MRVLVCPTAFKESLSAATVSEAIASGLRQGVPEAEITELPLSDGGPGLVESLRAAAGGRVEEVDVAGPLLGQVRGRILWTPSGPATTAEGDGAGQGYAEAGAADPDAGDAPGAGRTAVIESADACGLHLMPEGSRAPLTADTQGVGELVRAAEERGAARVVLGLGGSGTVDGGSGLARAFGYRFLDDRGTAIAAGGGPLRRLARITGGREAEVDVVALADVRTPLLGPRGAARTFGPQKGAGAREVDALEEGLSRLAGRIETDLGRSVGEIPGGGAAGGLGAGAVAFLGAELVQGADWVLSRVGFPERLEAADLVVTGEGAFDPTSLDGKVTGEVIRRARAAGRRVLLICGRLEDGEPEGVRVADAGGDWLEPASLASLAAREGKALAG
jgi:glycerate kinase